MKAPALVTVPGWNDAGTQAIVVAVPFDWHARFVHTVSADSGTLKTVDVLRDTTWVDGPSFGDAGWIDGGKAIWYASEADGWAHLYTIAPDGSDRRQLTKGKWEVMNIDLSDDRQVVLSHHEREVALRAPVLPDAGERRRGRRGGADHDARRRAHRGGVARRDDARRRVLVREQAARAVRHEVRGGRRRDAAHDVADEAVALAQVDRARRS